MSAAHDDRLDPPFDVRPGGMLRRAPGRETFLGRGPAGEPAVIKRYDGRAGLVERENLVALARAGLPVPAALGARARGRSSLVAMAFVPHAQTLRDLAAEVAPAERARRAGELLDLVVALHGAGWYHRDLYLEHFLVRADDGRLVLIDVGRARRRRRPRRRWLVKDLAALLHSTPPAVGPRERLRFLARYLDARGVEGRRARRRWLRAVVAKERRMAAHPPRFGRSFPLPAQEGA